MIFICDARRAGSVVGFGQTIHAEAPRSDAISRIIAEETARGLGRKEKRINSSKITDPDSIALKVLQILAM